MPEEPLKYVRPHKGPAPHVRTSVLVILAVILVLVLGNYHIVSDAPTVLVARPYFGFSDMFASGRVCTTGPWVLAKAQHPSLCLALQDAGLIETDEDFKSRIKDEFNEKLEARRACTSKCNIRDSNYVSCMSAC